MRYLEIKLASYTRADIAKTKKKCHIKTKRKTYI